MNLNSIVAPYIGVVNPNILVQIQPSIGQGPTTAAGRRPPLYAAPGSLTGSIAGTVLTVTAVASGKVIPGVTLADNPVALLSGTMVTRQLSGAEGGVGTYAVSRSQTVASETMTTSMSLIAQVQPESFRDIQQMDGINLQGIRKVIYVNGDLDGLVRYKMKGGDLVTLPDSSVWLVAMPLEDFNVTAGWTKVAMTLQNGS